MDIKFKLWMLSLFLVSVLTGVAIFNFWNRFQDQESRGSKELLMLSVGNARLAVEAQTKSARDEFLSVLALEWAYHLPGSSEVPGALPQSEELLKNGIQALVVLNPESEGYRTVWLASKIPSLTGAAQVDGLQLWKKIPLARADLSSLSWTMWTPPQGAPQLVAFMRVKNKLDSDPERSHVAVAIYSSQFFNSMTQVMKSLGSELFMVDHLGHALYYPDQNYVGGKLVDHPVVKALNKSQELKDFVDYLDDSGAPRVGFFERVQGSNLYLVMSAPLMTFRQVAAEHTLVLLFSAAGLVILFSFALGWIVDPFWIAFNYLRETIVQLAAGNPIRQPQKMVPELAVLSESYQILQKKVLSGALRMQDLSKGTIEKPKELPFVGTVPTQDEAYKQVGQGLSQSLRGPVSAILGHAQMARSKSGHEGLKEHFVVIEREARRMRDVIENLAKVAGEPEVKQKKIELLAFVLPALSALKDVLQAEGVNVKKDFRAQALIRANPAQLRMVMEQIFRNSIEAMRGREGKEILVATRDLGDQVEIVVRDTGKGIPPENLERVFEPFFTTKDGDKTTGVGLTLALGVVRGLGGEIHIESTPDVGTQVIILLPSAASEKLVNVDEVQDEFTQTAAHPLDVSFVGEVTTSRPQGQPSLSGANLLGRSALSGSKSEDLPASPGVDEVTFAGESPELNEPFPELPEHAPEPGVESKAGESMPPVEKVLLTPDFQVQIRKPKVKSE